METLQIRRKAIPVEIVLQIVECIDYEPGIIRKIMGTCRAFRDVLTQYEHSISRKLASSFHPSSDSSKPLRSSSLKQSLLCHSTYPWVHELYIRSLTVSQLMEDSLLSLNHIYPLASAKTNSNLQKRILFLLYELSDLGDRDTKEAWIESEQRSREELAVIYGMVAIISENRRTLVDSSAMMNSLGSTLPGNSPDAEVSQNLSSEVERRLQIEEDCVYRELCLSYGPYFIQASVTEGVWFDKVMCEGMKELTSFEAGEVEDYRGSLQGLIFQHFCRMVGCGDMEGWFMMWKEINSVRMQ